MLTSFHGMEHPMLHAMKADGSALLLLLQDLLDASLRRFAASTEMRCREGREGALEGSGKGFGWVPVSSASMLHTRTHLPQTCSLWVRSAEKLQTVC